VIQKRAVAIAAAFFVKSIFRVAEREDREGGVGAVVGHLDGDDVLGGFYSRSSFPKTIYVDAAFTAREEIKS